MILGIGCLRLQQIDGERHLNLYSPQGVEFACTA